MAEGRVHLHEVDALIHAAQVFTLTAVSKCDTPPIFFNQIKGEHFQVLSFLLIDEIFTFHYNSHFFPIIGGK